jgi:DNA-binding NtrC family response regulator
MSNIINGLDMKKHILIVDDEEYLLTTLQRNLTKLNRFKVTTTTDVLQIINVIKDHSIDVLITDLFMPVKAGLELVAEVRKKYPAIKIITMSGSGPIMGSEYEQLADECGEFHTINKPFTTDQLVAAIVHVLESD